MNTALRLFIIGSVYATFVYFNIGSDYFILKSVAAAMFISIAEAWRHYKK